MSIWAPAGTKARTDEKRDRTRRRFRKSSIQHRKLKAVDFRRGSQTTHTQAINRLPTRVHGAVYTATPEGGIYPSWHIRNNGPYLSNEMTRLALFFPALCQIHAQVVVDREWAASHRDLNAHTHRSWTRQRANAQFVFRGGFGNGFGHTLFCFGV